MWGIKLSIWGLRGPSWVGGLTHIWEGGSRFWNLEHFFIALKPDFSRSKIPVCNLMNPSLQCGLRTRYSKEFSKSSHISQVLNFFLIHLPGSTSLTAWKLTVINNKLSLHELAYNVSLVIFITPLTILNIELCHSLSVTIKESNSDIIDWLKGLEGLWSDTNWIQAGSAD